MGRSRPLWLASSVVAVCGSLAACRERVDSGPQGPGAAPAPALTSPAATRILYPSAPGSFVDLVAGARHGVVAIRSGSPVKSGPAAIFPGTPETTADIDVLQLDTVPP